jgi:hypothetical protein
MSFGTTLRGIEALMRLSTAATRMNLAAAEVIWRRSALMATGALTGAEALRMMTEKHEAFAQGARNAAVKAASGAHPAEVASAAMRPAGARARANARRLRK